MRTHRIKTYLVFFKRSKKVAVMRVYNVIVNVGDDTIGNNGFVKYHKISSLERFKSFLNTKYPKWAFATVYDYETKQKTDILKRG